MGRNELASVAAVLTVTCASAGACEPAEASLDPRADDGGADGRSGDASRVVPPGGDASVVRDDAATANDGSAPGDGGGEDAGGNTGTGPDPLVVTSLAGGGHSMCARSPEGALSCWGAGKGSPTALAGRGYRSVEVGLSETCAVGEDGAIYCWRSESYTPALAAAGSYASVAVAEAHRCAITADGALHCWGQNDLGQLGVGDIANRAAPTPVGSDRDWARVVVGGRHTCALKTTGALLCWGSNLGGQVGDGGGSSADGGQPHQRSPQPVPAGPGRRWVDVDAGTEGTCGLQDDGSLWCWGYHLPIAVNFVSPTRVGSASDWARVRLGHRHGCATKTNGTLHCFGFNDFGEVGDGTRQAKTTPTPIGTDNDWVDLAMAQNASCASKRNGTVRCWGWNAVGQTGTGDFLHATPTRVGDGAEWLDVSAGRQAVCGVKKNGSLACWGLLTYLGGGADPSRPGQIGTATNWSRVSVGGDHACVLAGTALSCWGDNRKGQLGVGNRDGIFGTPQPVPLAARGVAAGLEETCAIDGDASLHCWGGSPAKIGGDTWTQVTMASASCGLRTGGVLSCWTSSPPGTVVDGTWSWIATGFNGVHSAFYGIKSSELWSWSTLSSSTRVPAKIGSDSDWTAVSAGGGHYCALKTNGTLHCGGANEQGQLGDGTTTARKTPVPVVGGHSDWTKVSVGNVTTCALRNGGELYCWGYHAYGQTGDGTAWKLTPQPVVMP